MWNFDEKSLGNGHLKDRGDVRIIRAVRGIIRKSVLRV
jgi:hypothetical protein